jgi:hypothetical protein
LTYSQEYQAMPGIGVELVPLAAGVGQRGRLLAHCCCPRTRRCLPYCQRPLAVVGCGSADYRLMQAKVSAAIVPRSSSNYSSRRWLHEQLAKAIKQAEIHLATLSSAFFYTAFPCSSHF